MVADLAGSLPTRPLEKQFSHYQTNQEDDQRGDSEDVQTPACRLFSPEIGDIRLEALHAGSGAAPGLKPGARSRLLAVRIALLAHVGARAVALLVALAALLGLLLTLPVGLALLARLALPSLLVVLLAVLALLVGALLVGGLMLLVLLLLILALLVCHDDETPFKRGVCPAFNVASITGAACRPLPRRPGAEPLKNCHGLSRAKRSRERIPWI